MKAYRCIFVPFDPATGNTPILGFCTGAGMYDSSGNWFEPRIIQPALFKRSISIDSLISGGKFESSVGELVLANADGALDYLQTYAFDGRYLDVEIGDDDDPDGFSFSFTAMMETAIFAWDTVTIRLMDRSKELEKKPLHLVRYAGSNSLPNGTEGTSSDLKGIVKPLSFGGTRYIPPLCVNTAKLIYQVAHGDCHVYQVDDGGVDLTVGSSTTNIETATAPASGTFIWDNAGRFRLGTAPTFEMAAQLIDNVNGNACGSIIKAIAKQAGLVDINFNSADITALNSLTMSNAYFAEETTVAEALNYVCQRIGAWWGFDNSGLFRVKQLAAPSGSPVASFDSDSIIQLDMETGGSVPIWKVNCNYAWKVKARQRTELAGSLAEGTVAIMASMNLATEQHDTGVQAVHPLAEEFKYDTLLSGASVDADVTRILNLLKVQRNVINCTVYADQATAGVVDLGSVVQVTLPRYDMAAGKLFLVTKILYDYRKSTMEMTLWG